MYTSLLYYNIIISLYYINTHVTIALLQGALWGHLMLGTVSILIAIVGVVSEAQVLAWALTRFLWHFFQVASL